MWTTTYHRFLNRAAFLAACDAAGWPRGPDNSPMPPEQAALVEIGPLVAPPGLEANGIPIPGEVLDPRHHVNAAWHGLEVPEAFRAAAVAPATPNRCFALPAPPPAVASPVPATIPAWKGKAALREAGLLDAVEAAVAAAGGRVHDAWAGASEWSRDSDFLLILAEGLGLPSGQVDALFRSADAMQS
jgi:hypothetical protein